MLTPGAAIKWFRSELDVAKFEKSANLSSAAHVKAEPDPHGWPSESPNAETVMTSSYAAGLNWLTSVVLLPAATTNVTPSPTARQMAMCIASAFVFPQL